MTDLRFLVGDASDEQLLAATADNHIDWLVRLARGSGGTVSHEHGVHWTHVSRRNSEVTAAITAPPGPQVRGHLDELLEFSRARQVDRVGYWAFSTDYRLPLGVWLGARGFRTGGRPHWMYLDAHTMTDLPPLPELTAELGITLPDRFEPRECTPLPCFDPDTARVRAAMTAERPRRVWHAVMWEDGEPYGQISIDATSGELGVCGLHDTVVQREKRVSGIGIKRLLWVCRFALDLGCRYLVTNAAEGNAPLFGVWGFRSLGYGQTWWLPGGAVRDGVPAEQVAFAEAVGFGDLDALDALPAPADLDAPLANGITPLQFAGMARRTESARWLLERGARPDVLAAWDLGGAAEAGRLLADRPDLLDQRRPRSGKTLLHVAAERDDTELAELLLAAGIDTTVTDNRFGRTAFEHARQLRRAGVASAIRRHEAAAARGDGP